MILSKQQYYKRRWFLAILFLLVGFLLLYLSYGIFSYNIGKEDLIKQSKTPMVLQLAKTEWNSTESLILTIKIDKNQFSAVINDSKLKSFAKIFKISHLTKYNMGQEIIFTEQDLVDKQFNYSFRKDKLYELKIDEYKILEYKRKKPLLGYLVLILAIVWIGFQIWIIYTLKTKGIKVYDEFDKNI